MQLVFADITDTLTPHVVIGKLSNDYNYSSLDFFYSEEFWVQEWELGLARIECTRLRIQQIDCIVMTLNSRMTALYARISGSLKLRTLI